MVDEALLGALDSGHLAGTALDVFNIEPLPPDHRYWTPPGAQVTPHIAGATNRRTASPSSGPPGRLALFQTIMSKCAHGTSLGTSSLR